MKKNNFIYTKNTFNFQKGVALFTIMIFLIVLTMLGLTAMRGATLGERIARNQVDKVVAIQAAEAALRDAEKDINWRTFDNVYCGNAPGICRSSDYRPLKGLGETNFAGLSDNCDNGQCYRTPANYFPTPVWEDAEKWENAVTYGKFTGAPALTAVVNQPKYLIEKFRKGNNTLVLRISALGYGSDENTKVILQSIYIPRI